MACHILSRPVHSHIVTCRHGRNSCCRDRCAQSTTAFPGISHLQPLFAYYSVSNLKILFLPRLRSSHATPVKAIRQGIGAGEAEHSVKALQIALSEDLLGRSPNDDGKKEGYEVSFTFVRPRVTNARPGMYMGPDRPYETKHAEKCRQKYSGLSTCLELQGVNLNPHEQNHSKKTKHLRKLRNMGYDAFSFATTLVNELENREINRNTCDGAVGRATGHTRDSFLCRTELWTCCRGFCNAPLMRSFDEQGVLNLTFLRQEP